MIDININTILSQALAAAVAQAIQPLQQEYANKMAEMAQRIAALENQALVEHDAVDARIAALENNPAQAEKNGQGVDTTLNAWEMAMQNRVVAVDAVAQRLHDRVAALETHTAVLDQHGGILEYLDNQEWFWAKLRRFTDTAVEQAMEEHTETYDHSDFVTEDKLDDYVQKDSFRDEIEDVLNNATIRIRF